MRKQNKAERHKEITTQIKENSDNNNISNRRKISKIVNEKIFPQKTTIIEGKEYDLKKTQEITIEGEIIPKNIKFFKNLRTIVANNIIEIPSDLNLTKITRIEANSIIELPKTLPSLQYLIANSLKSIPNSLVNLRGIEADSITTIPANLKKIGVLKAKKLKILNSSLPNLYTLEVNELEEISGTFPYITDLDAYKLKIIKGKFINLTRIKANNLIEISNRIPNLKTLQANKLKNIPNTFTNLENLYANSITSIPNTFTKIERLYANSITYIPNTFINLKILRANSATSIPNTLKNLKVLQANSARNIPNSFKKLVILEAKNAISIPKTLNNIQLLYVSSAKEIPTNMPNLKHLKANSITSIPNTLITLEILEANSIKSIPKEFINLKHLEANSIKSIPSTLTTLETLEANSITTIPSTFIKLKTLKAKSLRAEKIPKNILNILNFVITKHSTNSKSLQDFKSIDQRVLKYIKEKYDVKKEDSVFIKEKINKEVWLKTLIINNPENQLKTIYNDPSLSKIGFLKDTWISDINEKAIITRNLYFANKKITKENVENAYNELLKLRKKYGKITIFKNRNIVIGANSETWGYNNDSDGYRFGKLKLRNKIKQDGGKIKNFIRPTTDNEIENYQKLKEKILESIKTTPPPFTFLFDGHGFKNLLSMDSGNQNELSSKQLEKVNNARITVQELFNAYKIRKNKFKDNNDDDIFMMIACHNVEFVRTFQALCKKNKIKSPIFISPSEYGQFGLSNFNSEYGSKIYDILFNKKGPAVINDIINTKSLKLLEGNPTIFVPTDFNVNDKESNREIAKNQNIKKNNKYA